MFNLHRRNLVDVALLAHTRPWRTVTLYSGFLATCGSRLGFSRFMYKKFSQIRCLTLIGTAVSKKGHP